MLSARRVPALKFRDIGQPYELPMRGHLVDRWLNASDRPRFREWHELRLVLRVSCGEELAHQCVFRAFKLRDVRVGLQYRFVYRPQHSRDSGLLFKWRN